MGKDETLATIWEIPDHLWEQIHPVILDMDPPQSTGRKRADPRRMLDGIIFRMRSGCQWNRLPRELGDDSTIHRTFQGWVELGVLEGIWTVLVEGCEELGGVDWEWQSADCSMGKARLGGAIGRNPTDRGQAGSKQSILVDAAGGPLSVAVAGANVHDTKLLRPTLESIVVARPEGTQNLCLDNLCLDNLCLDPCAWTKGMTIPPATGPLLPSSTVRTSGAWGRRSWTDGESRPFLPAGGWWSAP